LRERLTLRQIAGIMPVSGGNFKNLGKCVQTGFFELINTLKLLHTKHLCKSSRIDGEI